jgi:hypothetical protein
MLLNDMNGNSRADESQNESGMSVHVNDRCEVSVQ